MYRRTYLTTINLTLVNTLTICKHCATKSKFKHKVKEKIFILRIRTLYICHLRIKFIFSFQHNKISTKDLAYINSKKKLIVKMIWFWPQSVILPKRPGLVRSQITRCHYMSQFYGRFCSGIHRTSYTRKNPNLYPHQSRITLHTLQWDTLYQKIWEICLVKQQCSTFVQKESGGQICNWPNWPFYDHF